MFYYFYNTEQEACNILYQQILNKSQQIEGEIQAISQQLQQYPEGRLISTQNGAYTKWYHQLEGTLCYIPKKKKELAEQLAVKKYYTLRMESLKKEKYLLDSYLKYHIPEFERKDYKFLCDSKYHELLIPYFTSDDSNLDAWQRAPFQSNPKHPEQLLIKTCSG